MWALAPEESLSGASPSSCLAFVRDPEGISLKSKRLDSFNAWRSRKFANVEFQRFFSQL
jgi:hypothetical protein